MKKQNKGITLVALIVTIIILLILAGIAISSISGENGLISKMKLAKEKYSISESKEKLELSITELRIEKESKGERLSKEDLSKLNSDEIDVESTESFPVEVIYGKYKFNVDENFVVTYVGEADGTIITYTTEPEGYTNGDKVSILLKFSSPIGIKKVEYPQGEDSLNANGKKEVALDYKVTANGTYTFKVIDNNNNVVTKDVVIDKIDKLAPLDFTPTVDEIKATSLVIKVNANDADANETSTKSGIERYEYYVNGTKYESKENSYKVTGLTENTTYSIYVITYDKAENAKKSDTITQATNVASFPTLTLNGFVGVADGTKSIRKEMIDGNKETYYDSGNVPSFLDDDNLFYIDEECWNKYLSVYTGPVEGWVGSVVRYSYYGLYSGNGTSLSRDRFDFATGFNSAEKAVRSVKIPEGTVKGALFSNGRDDRIRYYEVWCSDEDLTGTVY